MKSYALRVSPGVTAFLTDNLAAEALIGVVGFSVQRGTTSTGGKRELDDLQLLVYASSLNIGLAYYFLAPRSANAVRLGDLGAGGGFQGFLVRVGRGEPGPRTAFPVPFAPPAHAHPTRARATGTDSRRSPMRTKMPTSSIRLARGSRRSSRRAETTRRPRLPSPT